MTKKTFSRFLNKSWKRLLLVWLILIITFLSYEIIKKSNKDPKSEVSNNSENLQEPKKLVCSHWRDCKKIREKDVARFFTEWECDYCGKVIKWGWDNHPKPNEENFESYFNTTRPKLNFLVENHLKNCEKAQEILSAIDTRKDNSLTYDNESSIGIKGYHDIDDIDTFSKFKNWGLVNRIILPDLGEKSRTGMVIGLSPQSYLNNLVLLVPRSTHITLQNFSESLKKNEELDFFYTSCGSEEISKYDRIVVSFFIWRTLQKKKSWNYNVFHSIINLPKYVRIRGSSGTLSLYLSLLSVYYQKPISREVAASGFLNFGNYSQIIHCPWCLQEELIKNSEKIFNEHKVSCVDLLERKLRVAAEVGVKKLILSTEQKEDYEKNIPQELKQKLQIYYVKNVEELP